MSKKIISFLIWLVVIPAVILSGVWVFNDRKYGFIALAVAVLACLPFFIGFEKKETSARQLTVLAAFIALSVAGRAVFAGVPHFKPVAAMCILCGIYFGAPSGFLCGALSAVLSNFIFGQGPWTPFQMLGWGLIGLIAGLLSKPLKKNSIFICVYGIFAGIIYSSITDVWTTLWQDNFFNLSRFLFYFTTALPVTVMYSISNIVFLLVLKKLFGNQIERLQIKYNL